MCSFSKHVSTILFALSLAIGTIAVSGGATFAGPPDTTSPPGPTCRKVTTPYVTFCDGTCPATFECKMGIVYENGEPVDVVCVCV